jgi:hypothetical protein
MKRIAKTDHPYFISRSVINLEASISTGTVVVAAGGTWAQGSSPTIAAWTSANTVGRCIAMDGEEYHYDIAAWESAGTGGVVAFDHSAKWLNAALNGGDYVIYTDTYDLPSDFRTMGKIMEPSLLAQIQWIPSVSDWYYIKMQNHGLTGPPQWGCLANGKLYLWPYPTTLQVLSFPYFRWPTTMSSDTDTMDFDDNQIEVVYRAIELELAIERKRGVKDARAAFRESLQDIMKSAASAHSTFQLGSAGIEEKVIIVQVGNDS